MKKLIVGLLLSLSMVSMADDLPFRMKALCQAMMDKGTCGVENSKPIPESERHIVWNLGKYGKVTAGDYSDVKALGKEMCNQIPAICTDMNSPQCRVVQSQFKGLL